MRARKKTFKQRRRRGWTRYSRERLLDVRLCDLDVDIAGTMVEKRIERLHRELSARNLLFRPYFWLSDDWFTPDGLTGTAVPFYLAHPRLMKLERSMIGEAEGGTEEWCMKFLRHEAGHAIDHAFGLHRRRRWQQLFGLSSHSYPRFYRPNPYSKRHVQHLEYWYAQSHPDEDFAETFAVWLQPRAHWRKQYRDWPAALRKLEYVNELMYEIGGTVPPVRTREYMDQLRTLRKTLREHYGRKRAQYGGPNRGTFDRDLRRLFVSDRGRVRREMASAFIHKHQAEIKRVISPWMADRRYHINHVLKEIVGRCRELRLYARGSERRLKTDLAVLLTKHVVESLYRHRYRVEM